VTVSLESEGRCSIWDGYVATTGPARVGGAVAGDGLPELSGSAPGFRLWLNDQANSEEARQGELFMLFHIIAQHDHTTCGRVQNGKVVPLPSTAMPWINGNEHVKVVGAWGYPVEHKTFAVVESDSFDEVAKLFESHLAMGPVEVLPVSKRK
jgi:hypothetical protein